MVKRYEPCHKWYAYDNEPTPEMQESAYGDYVKLETFKHEMARMQAQVDRMRKEGQRLHEVELTLKSQINGLEITKAELLVTLKVCEKTIDRLWVSHHANAADYALDLTCAAIKKHGGNS